MYIVMIEVLEVVIWGASNETKSLLIWGASNETEGVLIKLKFQFHLLFRCFDVECNNDGIAIISLTWKLNNKLEKGTFTFETALFGMDISHYKSRKMDLFQENILDIDFGEDAFLSDDYFEVEDSNQTYGQLDWGMPENTTWMHPVYFARCLTKAVNVEHEKFMDKPSNGVSVSGILRPTFVDEEFYLRRLFSRGDSDDFSSDYKDEDSVSSIDDENCPISTIYRLDITKIELFSVYGVQSLVNLQDFQYAEPDVLVHSSPTILENFGERGTRSGVALKALCKKKGLQVERANLIGVDSLGIDVSVFRNRSTNTAFFLQKQGDFCMYCGQTDPTTVVSSLTEKKIEDS